MKKMTRILSAALVLAFVAMFAFTALPAYADDPADGVSRAQSGMNSINSGNTTDLTGTIKTILSSVFVVVGILAVIVIIIGGVNYTLSQGDPGKVKKAKDTILYGIIGLIVALLAFAIVQFVLDALQ
jgi:TRAP-type C4-dicarboxylate transport system permease small subunit